LENLCLTENLASLVPNQAPNVGGNVKKTDLIQMKEQLFATLGLYRPSFFRMQVNRTSSLRKNCFNKLTLQIH
jgi:hypothetical protein